MTDNKQDVTNHPINDEASRLSQGSLASSLFILHEPLRPALAIVIACVRNAVNNGESTEIRSLGR
jgi:hypothetical protein